jgi:hypothetical protein
MVTPAVPRLRFLTGGSVAASLWLLANNTPVVVKNTQAEYDDFAVRRGGRGFIAGRPEPDARFLMAAGGIPAINTLDGWPSPDDCWEYDDPETGKVLIYATDWRPLCLHEQYVTDVPVGGRSNFAGGIAVSQGTRQGFRTYNLLDLGSLVVTRQPKLEYTPITGNIPNTHSVTFDATSSGQADPAASITISHTTTTEAERYIASTATCRAGQTLSTVTYNAVGLTSRQDVLNGNTRGYLFDLVAPATGANNLVVTYSASTSGVAGCRTGYGVDQTTPRTGTGNNTGNSTAPTITIASAVGELVCSMVCWPDNQTLTPDGTWVTDWNLNNTDAGGNWRNASGSHIAGASSVTYTGTLSAPNVWVALAVAIKAALPAAEIMAARQMAGQQPAQIATQAVSY